MPGLALSKPDPQIGRAFKNLFQDYALGFLINKKPSLCKGFEGRAEYPFSKAHLMPYSCF